jgi:mono/diheme cytochrome c family protein
MLLPLLALALASCGGNGDTSAGQATEPDATIGTTTAETEGNGDVERGNPQAGELIFVTQGCGFCHTLADVDATGTVGPNLDQSKPSYDLVVERVTKGKSPMPSFKDDISPQDIQDVAAYVSSVAGKSSGG